MYDSAVADFARGELDWERDPVKVLLVSGEYMPSQAQDATRADLRGTEIPATGSYKPGGKSLPGREVVRSELGGDVRLLGGSVEWTGMTAEFRYAVVVCSKGDRLVAYTDLGRQVASNARVVLEYDRDGGVAEFTVLAA